MKKPHKIKDNFRENFGGMRSLLWRLQLTGQNGTNLQGKINWRNNQLKLLTSYMKFLMACVIMCNVSDNIMILAMLLWTQECHVFHLPLLSSSDLCFIPTLVTWELERSMATGYSVLQ